MIHSLMQISLHPLKPLLFLVVLLSFFSPITAHAFYEKETSLRGMDREEARFDDPLRDSLSALGYVPRQLLNGVFFGAAHTADVLSDKDFIRKVKDILYFNDKKGLWYPMVSYASGFRPAYGGGLRYKGESWKASAKALMHDSDYGSYSFKPTVHKSLGTMQWKNSVQTVFEKKDDRRFYGLGADPHNDDRNRFVGSHDYGVYTESRRKIQWESALHSSEESWGVTYLGYYQRRSFEDHGSGNNDVREVFDHSAIPGFDAPVKQLYNELALEMDTRKQKAMLHPGFRSEIYSGISAGFGKHDANLLRTGFDAAGFIPTVKEDRLIVPRLVADVVENINDKPIPFSEYPRQQPFRGVSNREIGRSERVSLVPSFEYQWPLSHMLAGHLFCDLLFVGPRPGSIRWHEGLWAAGAGVDLHILNHELGKVELAWGSEGFQASLTIGVPLKNNHRKDW